MERLPLKDGERLLRILELLKKEYPEPKTALEFGNPLELLVATMLSAQCTDKRVNLVTKELFKKYRSPEHYARAALEELEQDIRSTGFYRNKARNLKNCCKMIVEKFGSEVPNKMEDLISLPGVARKTANIVLANAYGVIEGIAVDTHVRRLAQRLGLTKNKDPNKIEADLMALAPKGEWSNLSHLLIFHGRKICRAKKPKCGACVLNTLCPSAMSKISGPF